MASITAYVNNYNDNCWVTTESPPAIWLGIYISAGRPASDHVRNAGMIFRNINIPRGSIINSAIITFTATATLSDTVCNTRFYGENSVSPSTFSSVADYNERSLTTTYINWDNLSSWTIGSTYDSPEIKTIIQEIIDRDDWQAGKDICIFWKDNGSTSPARRAANGYPESTREKIVINYTSTGIFTDYGIKISKTGKDVLTDGDDDMVFTTKFSIPKAINWEEKDLDIVGNPYDYSHDVEKIPFVLIYGTDGVSDKVLGFYYNIYDPDTVRVLATANSTKVKVYLLAGTNKKAYFYIFTPEI